MRRLLPWGLAACGVALLATGHVLLGLLVLATLGGWSAGRRRCVPPAPPVVR